MLGIQICIQVKNMCYLRKMFCVMNLIKMANAVTEEGRRHWRGSVHTSITSGKKSNITELYPE